MLRLAFLLMLLSNAAQAAPVAVDVHGPDGRPLVGAVVQLQTRAPAPPPASSLRGPFVMTQKDISFSPHVLIVPVGATVSFPNEDHVRHHVYSFSSAKRFQIKLYGEDQTRSERFDKPGVIALGCNIHDVMSGFIVVSATPFAALTDARGRATFASVPPGAATLTVWHPSIRQPGNMQAQAAAVVPAGLATTVTIRR